MQVSGQIVSLQERRFRIVTDDGRALLLRLGRHASVDATELADFQRRAARVTVDYSGEPNMTDGVARDVREGAA